MALTVEIIQARLRQGTVIGSLLLSIVCLFLEQRIPLEALCFRTVVHDTASSHGEIALW